jgi:hypothetical protein
MFNTDRHARSLRKAFVPKQFTASPYQWGYVEAVHTPSTTTLSAACAAGASSIQTAASVPANSLIIVGTGGPVVVQGVTGTGPYTLALAARGVPHAQNSGATVRVLPTVDLYLDGWQSPPGNLPVGVTKTLTTGVRYNSTYVPVVGHVVLVARGTGLQRSDRVVLGRVASGPVSDALLANPAGKVYAVTGGIGTSVGAMFSSVGTQWLKGGMKASSRGLIVPVAGVYAATFSCWCSMGGAAGQSQCYLENTNGDVGVGNIWASVPANTGYTLSCATEVECAAGAELYPAAISANGNASISLLNSAGYNALTVSLVSR